MLYSISQTILNLEKARQGVKEHKIPSSSVLTREERKALSPLKDHNHFITELQILVLIIVIRPRKDLSKKMENNESELSQERYHAGSGEEEPHESEGNVDCQYGPSENVAKSPN